MKEQGTAYEQANDYVHQIEEKWLVTAILNLVEAQHKVESCGCPNCRKRPGSLREVISDEICRLTVPLPPEKKLARVYSPKQQKPK